MPHFTTPSTSTIKAFSHLSRTMATASFRQPLLSVAPMMDWTDSHYRTLFRSISRHTWLYTEMVVDQSVIHNTDRMLKYNKVEHPVVVQLGGSNPPALQLAAAKCVEYGYDEINLNCGCPSDRVQDGCFGAVLMKTPSLVAECMNSINESAGPAGVPVTVKCRIGVDDCDSYEELQEFIRTISETAPVDHFLIHARKAFLQGLNPAQNRSVPPLHYDVVYRLIEDFPHLKFSINGGVQNLQEAVQHISKGVHGVMIGRAAYKSPWKMAEADRLIFGDMDAPLRSRREVCEEYLIYCEEQEALERSRFEADEKAEASPHKDTRPLNVRLYRLSAVLLKPLLGLFLGDYKGKEFRRNMDGTRNEANKLLKEGRACPTTRETLYSCLAEVPDEVLDALPGAVPWKGPAWIDENGENGGKPFPGCHAAGGASGSVEDSDEVTQKFAKCGEPMPEN